jgi:hypothetical protein
MSCAFLGEGRQVLADQRHAEIVGNSRSYFPDRAITELAIGGRWRRPKAS